MNATPPLSYRLERAAGAAVLPGLARALAAGICLVLAACGGSADAPPPPEAAPVGPTAVAPTITQQPASLSVTTGQPATFSVAASGTAPITYQWQRNGTAIAGATSTTYTIATTAMSDSGAVFDAVATNVAGSATSENATLTVTAAVPVLTITTQAANTSVVAGGTATFMVAGTCSSGTLDVQWQRSNDGGVTFVAIAGATSPTYGVMSATGDNGAQFRAVLDCSGQSTTTSSVATLTVTAPSSVTLSLLPINGLRAQADVNNSAGIVQDNLYSYSFIASNRIKRLSPDLSTVTTIAGVFQAGAIDGPGATASFRYPTGITHDGAGTLYVTDTGNNTIRKIATDGTVSTLAGSAGVTGSADGSGSAASFNAPAGIAIGPEGDLYVADTGNNLIRRVTTAGVVTTYAGGTSGSVSFAEGPALSARFNAPMGVAVASTGDVYVTDYGNQRVRWVARVGGYMGTAGNVSTIAGDGTSGTADGVGAAAQIPAPTAIFLNGTALYVSDEFQRIRKIDLATNTVTTFAGTNNQGSTVGNTDGPIGKAHFNKLAGIAGSTSGGLIVTDGISMRSVSAGGLAVTFATSAVDQVNDTGLGTLSQLPFALGPTPPGLLVEPGQSVVVADGGYRVVRRIAPGGNVSLIAGLPTAGPNGVAVDGQASGAQFSFALGEIATDASGAFYVVDTSGIRRIATDGTVSFIAGSPTAFGSPVDGNGSTVRFYDLKGIAVSSTGNIFVSDYNRIRRVDPAGNVTTFAGGTSGQVDGPIATAQFQSPTQLVFGPDGSLFVADVGAVRVISPDGQQVSTLIGPTLSSFTGIAVDSGGTLYYDGIGPDGQSGLRMRTSAGVDTLLIAHGPAVVLGASPVVSYVTAIAVYGPKQLVLSSGNTGSLYIATTP